MRKVVIAHPTGNANVRAITMGFLQAGMLDKFFTTIACFNNSWWLKTGLKDFARRRYDERLKDFTRTLPWTELARIAANRLKLDFLTLDETSLLSVDATYKNLDKYLAELITGRLQNEIIYGYEDGSYYSFKAAKKKNLFCVYDLPIAYWQTARTLLNMEAERYPAWKKTLAGGIADSQEKLERKTEELKQADVIVVPSTFVARSLPAWAADKKMIVSPFGTPESVEPGKPRQSISQKPLRVLFVGSMSQRKGLADLFEAVKLLNTTQVELVVLGSLMEELSFYKEALPEFCYEPPRSHAEVLEFMKTCDVFCLPSIVEGRALVMQEAMSRCLPLIITANTGGEDLIVNGETGFLVPVASPESIAEKLHWFLENRDQVPAMGVAASAHAASYTWTKYAHTIIKAIAEVTHE